MNKTKTSVVLGRQQEGGGVDPGTGVILGGRSPHGWVSGSPQPPPTMQTHSCLGSKIVCQGMRRYMNGCLSSNVALPTSPETLSEMGCSWPLQSRVREEAALEEGRMILANKHKNKIKIPPRHSSCRANIYSPVMELLRFCQSSWGSWIKPAVNHLRHSHCGASTLPPRLGFNPLFTVLNSVSFLSFDGPRTRKRRVWPQSRRLNWNQLGVSRIRPGRLVKERLFKLTFPRYPSSSF